jgi:hypothetical protein
MTESLKSVRILHNLLVLVCAAIIVFASTPDRVRRYSAAENELNRYSQISSNDYFGYVYSSLQPDRQIEKTRMINLLRGSGYQVPNGVSFIVPMWASSINAGGSLGTFCRLIQQQQTVTFARAVQDYPGPLLPLDGSQPAPKLDSLDVVTAIFLGSEPSVNPTQKFQLLNGYATEFPVSSFLVLAIRRHNGEQILSRLRIAYTSGTSETGHFGKDWLRSLPSASHLIEGNQCLPDSLQMYPEIDGMQPADARRDIESKREAEEKNYLEVSSLRIDSATASWAAPVLVALFLLFLISHLRQLHRISREERCPKNFPWVGIFPDFLGRLIAYVTVVLLPVLSEVLLTRRIAPSSILLRIGPPCGIAVLSIWAGIELFRIRRVIEAHVSVID